MHGRSTTHLVGVRRRTAQLLQQRPQRRCLLCNGRCRCRLLLNWSSNTGVGRHCLAGRWLQTAGAVGEAAKGP